MSNSRSNNITILDQELYASIESINREREHIDNYLASAVSDNLAANPMRGWLSDGIIKQIVRHQTNAATKRGSFLYDFQHINRPGDADLIKKAARFQSMTLHEGRDWAEKITPPYYFLLIVEGHFVTIEIPAEGRAIIHNELAYYDSPTKKILIKNLGFAEQNIGFPDHKNQDNYIQRDGFSCGDRAIRNLFKLLRITHPITDAKDSRSLRQHVLELIKEVHLANPATKRHAIAMNETKKEVAQRVKGENDIDPLEAKAQKNPAFFELMASINELKEYGESLRNENAITIQYLAFEIHKQVNEYITNPSNHERVSASLTHLVRDVKKSMPYDRTFLSVLGHLLFCLTGIGLLVLTYNAVVNRQFFLFEPKNSKMPERLAHRLNALDLPRSATSDLMF